MDHDCASRNLPTTSATSLPDLGIPEDETRFLKTVRRVANWLRTGHRVLVHCGAGIGRTGIFAICTLVALGTSLESAERTIREAGSGPETEKQRAFLHRVCAKLPNR